MTAVDVFGLLAAIYAAPHLSPRTGLGLSVACTAIAALCAYLKA